MPKATVVSYRRKANSGRTTYKQRERIIQRTLARDMNNYPEPIDFFCDWASGAFLTYGQNAQRLAMASKRGWVDIFIAEPRNGFHGLFIELKKEGSGAILKSGEFSKDKKLQGEVAFLKRMREKGYKAEMAIGYSQAKRMIDKYLGIKQVLFEDESVF